jgi:hypothetical protein
LFAWHFLRTLQNTKTLDTGTVVWADVRKAVMKEYAQHPQYGAVISAGHAIGGDYLFLPSSIK